MQNRLTTGKIGRSLISFSLPMIFGNLLQQLYNVADTLIVGKTIGPAALSAVGSSYALMVLLTSIVLGLCMGSSVVFSHLFGADKIDEMKISIFNSGIFIFMLSAAINIGAFLCLDNIILWLNIPKEAVTLTREYLKIIFSGMIFVTVYNFFASVLRSVGNTVIPLIFLAAAAVTNIVLDLLFILVFHMGVAGAAYATVIAQALSAICITVYFFVKEKQLCPAKQHICFDKGLLKRIVGNSVLTSVQQSIMNFGILMVQGLVNSFGFAVSAAFAAVVKIDAFAYMPAQDFGNAFATFIAQNHGAGQKERIHKGILTALKLSCVFCLFASACVYVFAKPLMLLFVNSGETQIINIGIEYLHIEGAFYVGIGILFLLYGLFRGLGKSSISIFLTVVSLGSRVALAYALSSLPSVGVAGIWWSVPIGWALADAAGCMIYLFRHRSHFIQKK